MTKDLLIILFAAPVAAVVLSFAIRSSRLSEYATVIAALIDLAVSIPLLLRVLQWPYRACAQLCPGRPIGSMGHPLHLHCLYALIDLCRWVHASSR